MDVFLPIFPCFDFSALAARAAVPFYEAGGGTIHGADRSLLDSVHAGDGRSRYLS
jgi:hypothetical protein